MSSMKGLESTENELVLLQGSDTGSEVDLYDVSLSPTSAPCDEKGKLYTVTFEVWVSDGNSSTLESIAKSVQHAIESHRVQSFKLWEELLRDDNLRSFPAGLRSIKAVEYTGEDKFDNQTICTKKGQLTVKVFAFKMNIDTEFNANNDSPGQLRLLPDRDLQAVWEGLVFDQDLRGKMIRIITNMVKFSRRRGQEERSSLSRLILLYGPPGTGKTSLALGLAQKASIRLIHEFGTLKLIQIDTSTIFSKWLGESAHKVKEIFSNIIEMCRNSPQHFTCVILDEIESLASSRAESSARMEVHDTVRATNALLQAFDTMLSQNNIIVIATSNLQELLDDAFLSRCDYSFFIDLPSAKARYEIMRGSLQTLISRGIIQTEEAIPYYDDILQTVNSQPDQLGSNVLRLAQSLAGQDCRILSKLAEAALIEQMVADTCSLSEALRFISKSLEEHRSSRFLKRRLSESIQKAKAGQDLVKSRVSRRQRMKLDDSQFVDRAAGNRTTSQDSIGRLFDSKVEFETDITSISSEEGSL